MGRLSVKKIVAICSILVLIVLLTQSPLFRRHRRSASGDRELDYTIRSKLRRTTTIPQSLKKSKVHNRKRGRRLTNIIKKKLRKILLWTPLMSKPFWHFRGPGSAVFVSKDCDVATCDVTANRNDLPKAHIVMMHLRDLKSPSDLPRKRYPGQYWVYMNEESPRYTHEGDRLKPFDGKFDLTITYRSNSDAPYPYGACALQGSETDYHKSINYAKGKRKPILALVSHCRTSSRREEYIRRMKSVIPVDVIGKCGIPDPNNCPKTGYCAAADSFKKQYKFYLAFENTLCREYITEKFWKALEDGLLPVVLGAPYTDYAKVAPPGSFIHTDNFTTPADLARYLKRLDQNDTAYNEYFKWKDTHELTGRPNGAFECHVCALAHTVFETPLKAGRRHTLSKSWSFDKDCRNVTNLKTLKVKW